MKGNEWLGNVEYNKRRRGEVVIEEEFWLSESAWTSVVRICERSVSKIST